MGPVSFERVGDGLDPARLKEIARRLVASGIRVRLVDNDTAILVRIEDGSRARAVLADADEDLNS